MVAYPDDISQRVRRLEQIVDRLFTAINTQPPQFQVGPNGAARIVLGIAPDGLPEIRFYPEGDDDYALLRAGGDGGSGIEILGLASVTGQRYALRVAQDQLHVLYADEAGVNDVGGRLILDTGAGYVGFWGDGSDEENYFQFASDGMTRHIGRWDADSAGTYWGLLVGAATVSSGFVGMNVNYGSTLATDVIPIVTIHDLSISSNPTFSWCLTARSSSSFSVDWENTSTTSKEATYVAFRV